MIEVTLEPHEMYMAASVGMMRRIASLQRGLRERHGNDGSQGWDDNIEGALGECAFAKAMDLYWDGSINRFSSGGDVGKNYQIRTLKLHWYDLLIRPRDADDKPYILVTGRSGKYQVHGWAYGREAKQEEWFEAKGGREAAYWMPQSALHSLDNLPGIPPRQQAWEF